MTSSRFATVVACAAGLILALWLWVAAPYGDDFMYARTVPDTCEADFWDARGSFITSFADAAGSLAPHWRHVNARGANLLMLLLVPLPRWALALVLGLAAAAWVRLTFKAASIVAGRELRCWVMSVGALALWLWFPWADELVAADCFVNYVVPSLAAVGFAVCFMNESGKHPRLRLAIGCAVAAVAGLMHEGFALPVAAGAVVGLCVFKPRLRVAVLMTIVLCIAAAMCSLAPSTLARLGRHDAHPSASIGALLHLWPLYITLFIVVWGWVTHRLGFVVKDRTAFVFWTTVAVASAGIAVVLGGQGRVLWPACMALYVLALGVAERVVLPGRQLRAVAVGALLLDMLYGGVLIMVQSRFSSVQYPVLERLDADPSSRIGVELPAADIPERLLRGMPRRYTQDCRSAMMIGTGRYRMEWGRVPLFVDAAWGSGDFETWPAASADGTLRGSGSLIYGRVRLNPGETLSEGRRIINRSYVVEAGGDTLYRYDIK